MNRRRNYDYIIAGAGCAGLSLAWFLMERGSAGKRVLIADKSLKPENDKTWCFWEPGDLPFPELIDYEWQNLEVRTRGFHLVSEVRPFGYYCVRSDSYHKKLASILQQYAGIDWLECSISGMSTVGEKARLQTSAGDFDAEYIFQSIRPLDIDSHQLNLKQHFTGWEIQTTRAVFDPDTACFMDLTVPGPEGITFIYVLPFSTTKAIVEYTLFSGELLPGDVYENGIREYLSSRLGLKNGDYSVIRSERGVIPMVENGFLPGEGRVINIGAAAGLAKASTGYTFTRTQTANRQIAEKLAAGRYPAAENPSSPRFRAYDILLLYIIKHHPREALRIFETLFRKNRLQAILKFLSEKTGIREEMKMFWGLPHRIFFTAICKTRKLLLDIITQKE
jgi:lycopene beta-cyclase